MRNAKEEFLDAISDRAKLKCAIIQSEDDNFTLEITKVLKCNYNQLEYEQFINSLNYEYDDGYGGQNLFGKVWFEDGTWCERGEYDGSEWWEFQCLPTIPEVCYTKDPI